MAQAAIQSRDREPDPAGQRIGLCSYHDALGVLRLQLHANEGLVSPSSALWDCEPRAQRRTSLRAPSLKYTRGQVCPLWTFFEELNYRYSNQGVWITSTAAASAAQDCEWAPAIEGIHRRARLHLAQLPPDQLNPRGHYDAGLHPVYDRAQRKRRRGGPTGDSRLGALPLELPEPGG